LCIDEVGYLSFDDKAADLLYEVINRRYERKSVIVTTNRPFKEWNEVFPNATYIATLLDRLLHHALASDGVRSSVGLVASSDPAGRWSAPVTGSLAGLFSVRHRRTVGTSRTRQLPGVSAAQAMSYCRGAGHAGQSSEKDDR
jgi:hypothetical protein